MSRYIDSSHYNAGRTVPGQLTADQVVQFHEQEFLGLFEAVPAEEMLGLRAEVTTLLQTKPNPFPQEGWHARFIPRQHNRFMDSAPAYRLSTLPEMVSRMTSILGEDFLLLK